MWDTIVNALSVAWTAVSQFFVTAFNVSVAFCLSVYDFLSSYLGSPILAIVTLSVIGLLAVLLIIFLIVAIINPEKRKKKKLEKLLKKQQEYDNLRKRFAEISEEINNLSLEIVLTQKHADDAIFNLQEQEKTAIAQDKVFFTEHYDKIKILVEKQRVLLELLKNQQKGWFPNKEKAESTKLLIDQLSREQTESSNAIITRTNDATAREEALIAEVKKITEESHAKRDELVAKRDELEAEKNKIQAKLDKMKLTGSYKLTLEDAKTMSEEFARQRKLEAEAEEFERNEAIRRAREAYEQAYKRRVQVEKDMAEIVDHVKQMQEEQAKVKSLKLSEFVPVTVTTSAREDEKPDDVNIIIADVNCETVFVPEQVEETQKADERVYSMPEVAVVDISTLPEEDVVFIEAFLDELESEQPLEENDLKEEQSPTTEPTTEEIEPTTAKTESATVEIVEEKTEVIDENPEQQTQTVAEEVNENIEPQVLEEVALTETIDTPEIIETEQSAQIEVVEPVIDEVAENENVEQTEVPQKKKPTGKIYNDGIPATPIHKKSKFAKPVTRIVKKSSEGEEVTETPTKAEQSAVKVGYSGKWIIVKNEDKSFAKLLASNGGVMIQTPAYSSVQGVLGSIANVKENIANAVIAQTKTGKYVYKVISSSKRTIATSDEYSTKYQCEKALESAKRFAISAVVIK